MVFAPRFGGAPINRARTQKASGDSIESLFAASHEHYLREGRAKIVKNHPPVGGAPASGLFYRDGAFVDYSGALAPRGLTVAFDVKGCTGATKLEPAALPSPHLDAKKYNRAKKDRERLQRQANLLLDLRRMGASVAFLCVDIHRARCWIIEDVGRIAVLEPVPFRIRDRDLVPSVPFSTPLQLARGAPAIDWLSIWPTL